LETDDLHIGQYVWWWFRKKGGWPKRRYGRILEFNEDRSIARIRLEEPHPMIAVQTIETKRLNKSF